MIILKHTTGWVTQVFDTIKNTFTEQRFIAGNPVEWEHSNSGRPVEMEEFDYTKPYMPFDMVGPNDMVITKEQFIGIKNLVEYDRFSEEKHYYETSVCDRDRHIYEDIKLLLPLLEVEVY